ncbi:MAG: NAD-dependent epimerase/dehydratase family protein [Thiolinea sp.]
MLKRLLITGAAGGIGKMIRPHLTDLAETLRLSDINDLGDAAANEELIACDLGDEAAVHKLVAGCDGILHLGGISVEDRFDKILNANIQGVYNLYEAARANGLPRIIFASSNHTVGFHQQDKHLDANANLQPDGLYGVSKCFGEAMASMYHNKFGQETAIVRIGSCLPEPTDQRKLATWLSLEDFISLIACAFRSPRLGCPIIYGASDNDASWWDNSAAAYLGWRPKDNSAVFRDKVYANVPIADKDAALAKYQGGDFINDPIFR